MGQQLNRSLIVFLLSVLSFPLFGQDTLSICSFNIQFLGHFKERNNTFLASILKEYDIVVVQEMVAPPSDGKYPDGSLYKKDSESADFVDAMTKNGFNYWLSEEDTGPTRNHTAGTGSEWWVTFYKPKSVHIDSSRCYGFLSETRTQNTTFERVPYAFPFKSADGKLNFTLISVHLKPGDNKEEKQRRQEELNGAIQWISKLKESNKDFYILGDCNIYGVEEIAPINDLGYYSLNNSCESTNIKMYEDPKKGQPYDHVFYSKYSKEDLIANSFQVVDLMSLVLKAGLNYSPYDHDSFRTSFSDHVPITFQLVTGKDSDL
jgi:exonuclease III